MTRIELAIVDGIGWITLDGAEKRNALDSDAATELLVACDRIDADATVGAAVITGAGNAFCSGADTAVLDSLRTAHPDRCYDGLDLLYAGFRRFAELSVPTVALVNGPAIGAGLNLALAADLRLASDNAVFVSGFAAVGIHPGGGHLHLLTRAAGSGVAAAAGVFAQPVGADRALAAGLVWAVAPAEELRARATDLVRHLAADPQLARALATDLRLTVHDVDGWHRAVEVERARQMWSLTRPEKEH